MSMITLDEAKNYLRVDSCMEDNLILSLLSAAEKLTTSVSRITEDEWEQLCDESIQKMTFRDTELSFGEIRQMRGLLRASVYYSLGYLYEHREEADYHDLVMTLRNLLSSVREGVF